MQTFSKKIKELICFNNVSFSYDEGVPILENINLSICTGETIAIVGQSGFGKSTLLKLCAGLLKPIGGRVSLMGMDTTLALDRELYSKRLEIGYVFQDSALISNLPVFENIALPLRYHTNLSNKKINSEVKGKISLLEIEGYEKSFPASLSSGIKKRTALARALIMDPSLIFYDEPTSGLDPLNTKKIDGMIRTLHHGFGITSLIVTHDLKSALKLASKLIFISDKKILFSGTAKEMAESDNKDLKIFLNDI